MTDTLAVLAFDKDIPPQSDSRPAPQSDELAGSQPGKLLELTDIHLSFGGVAALSGVSLDVEAGEIRSIIGPNGAGKSSLINIISGLYAADRGQISLAGQRFARVPAHRLARLGVARTFQNLALFGGLSVFDNIAAGRVYTRRASFLEQTLRFGRAPREERLVREKVREVIAFLHLEPYAGKIVSTLPYGLQKRVELARALVAEPRLLLLDEPMAGMTATEKAEMAAFVRAARDRHGITVVLIEHDIGVVMGLSDHVAVLDYGRKIADGPPSQVRSDPAVIRAYIGSAEDEAA